MTFNRECKSTSTEIFDSFASAGDEGVPEVEETWERSIYKNKTNSLESRRLERRLYQSVGIFDLVTMSRGTRPMQELCVFVDQIMAIVRKSPSSYSVVLAKIVA